ncbi:MAG: hypothetical protein MH252_01895 [Thermosynechococcaceae cyanobacterium MS004]|nr:hypothetical protein [Thermosynechococcaceae cyanobacterium MS004]
MTTNHDQNQDLSIELTDEDLSEIQGGGLLSYIYATTSSQAEDKLGNFEIQDLMSQYNQAEQLGKIKKK